MAEPFLSEIRIMSFNFPPKGWAFCNGQFLPINQNQALFSLLGTTYGGNGQTTFALPDLRGRVPVHVGSGLTLGQAGGQEAHTITQSEMPQHIHFANCATDAADAAVPGANLLGSVDVTTFGNAYNGPSSLVAMGPESVAPVGGSQPHENRQPFLVLNYCIALQGIFPSQN
ncbi:phage tail protein [Tahibacter amnicola]|uniref:Tail fiber protein n=1 Tax=Tahibacter amnicola TaxID=2976241 RepID=A0ABY6BJJ9_9GAMM|nr:tail fiber protein [Tahibacter amnicola]UXI69275.1 tail fiber protein [Tahibacter amnicola]